MLPNTLVPASLEVVAPQLFTCAGIPVCPFQGGCPWPGVEPPTTEPDTVRTWAHAHPDADIGIPTGAVIGLVAVEVDRSLGGASMLAQLQAAHAALPVNTPEARVDDSRSYLIFGHPGRYVRSGPLGAGLWLRADDDYIRVPRHIDPTQAIWLRDILRTEPVHSDAYPWWIFDLVQDAGGETVPAGQPAGTVQAAHAQISPGQPRQRFRVLSDIEMESQEPPEPLVDGVLPLGGLALLAGESGVMKTSTATDLAFSVATGTAWHGHLIVKSGTVLYIVAEGRGGFPLRVRAWKAAHGIRELAGVYFIAGPVDIVDTAQVSDLLAVLGTLPQPIVLVVIDTLARCFGESDENSARDMGMFIRGADRIRAHTGATVLVIHHTGWNKSRERGHSSLRAAVDTLMKIEKSLDTVRLSCVKQKDDDEFERLSFRVRVVPVGEGETSVVLDHIDDTGGVAQPGKLTASCSKALDVLEQGGSNGLTFTDWHRASGLARTTFDRARKLLLSQGHVCQDRDKYFVPCGREGDESDGPTEVPLKSHDTSGGGLTQSHPPEGVGRGTTPETDVDGSGQGGSSA